MNTCKRCIVSGRVQGVFYRASTQQQASALGVRGYAKNLNDGSVEVLACGEIDAVTALCEWLWQGPQMSDVSRVECKTIPQKLMTDFVIC